MRWRPFLRASKLDWTSHWPFIRKTKSQKKTWTICSRRRPPCKKTILIIQIKTNNFPKKYQINDNSPNNLGIFKQKTHNQNRKMSYKSENKIKIYLERKTDTSLSLYKIKVQTVCPSKILAPVACVVVMTTVSFAYTRLVS